MATLPTGTVISAEGYVESIPDPSVETTDMERGLAKYRIKNQKVVRTINATLEFHSLAALNAFDNWYFDTIKRIGWFDIVDPRTKVTRAVRLREGKIGDYVSISQDYEYASCAVVFEYLR